ncbi:NAD(P)H-dependent amine dehydrogenase family protein [Mycobacterium bourgelatii]|uniref:Diacylglycerol kinase n=1 Tax=Mycobacterium bourgelatii TaxID=1273442 RepID=A0A7I9YZ83_MYCBU|nr:diacylglycerol kinase [Mycobacterium bourgelatii]MCV6976590.1 diacylglycerol kinase [Mycobacterium bourgelatii]GFG94039.1 diacylglycerol kinase [Mycobacterium bourgelatii]
MAIRVAHVGTGNVGRLALIELVTNPQFELTGLCVSTKEKVGRDAGEMAGVDVRTGIAAVDDLDAVLATRPECVVYCAMGDTRIPDAMSDIMRILAAGINVVGSSPGLLQYPWGVMPDKYIARVEDAAQKGNSSVFITGVDPGFINDLIPFALTGTCQRVEQVRCMEIADYASYDGAEVMHYMGFGRPLDLPPGEAPMLLQPGVLTFAWGTAIRQLAAGLGIEVDEITQSIQREPAPEDFDIAVGRVPKGTLAGLQFEIRGMVNGHPAIVIEHITRLRPDLRPDWPQPAAGGGSYRVEITGEPSYTVDIVPSSRNGDHNYAAILGAAGRIVNAVPAVVAAPPGIRTTLDLPLIPGKGIFAPTGLVTT